MSVVHLLHGLPGTGKSTFARKLERETGAICLNHDECMTILFGNDPPAERFQEYADRIHVLLWSLTEKLALRGVDVILDHGFWTRASRDDARQRVCAMGAIPCFYEMVCGASLADARVLSRSKAPIRGVLHINQNALDEFRSRYEPMFADEERIVIETGQPNQSSEQTRMDDGSAI